MRIILTFLVLLLSSSVCFAFGSLEIAPVGPDLCGMKSVFANGQSVRLQGRSFAPSSSVKIQYQTEINTPHQDITTTHADANGDFDVVVQIPDIKKLKAMSIFYAFGVGPEGLERMITGMFMQTSDPKRDLDGDGIVDACDICPTVADKEQSNRDNDNLGDACDPHPDVNDPQDEAALMKEIFGEGYFNE